MERGFLSASWATWETLVWSHLKEVTLTEQQQPGRARQGSQHQAESHPTDMEGTAGTNFATVESTNFIPQLQVGNSL